MSAPTRAGSWGSRSAASRTSSSAAIAWTREVSRSLKGGYELASTVMGVACSTGSEEAYSMTLDQSFRRIQMQMQRISNMPLARKGAEDGERVLVLGCHVCIEEDDELGEKRGDGQRARGVGRCVGQRGEMPLFWRKVEHDGQMG